ncbi:MAG: Gfo/Idh/MocA family protein, partial [Planctomycetota bacterium]
MTTPLRFAVLGCGTHGSRYAEHLLAGDVPGATVVGVSRRSPEHAEKWTSRGVRFEPDALRLAVADDVDAVVVASPPHEHLPHAGEALRAGKHVLLEKPVAGTLADAVAIGEAAQSAERKVLVGHSFRYNAVARAWRDEVRTMGDLRQMVLSMRHEWLAHPWQMKTECGGGALLTVGVHMADLARWTTGDEIAEILACSTHSMDGEADRGAAVL